MGTQMYFDPTGIIWAVINLLVILSPVGWLLWLITRGVHALESIAESLRQSKSGR